MKDISVFEILIFFRFGGSFSKATHDPFACGTIPFLWKLSSVKN